MAKLGKKSLISYLQPVNIEDDQPFEQLQKMRLQDAILYAESIRNALPEGEFVSLTWQLDTKKGKSYTFSFHIGNLENEQTPLMTLVEEGVKENLSDQQVEEVLAILPLHYEAKEKEFEGPRQWILENQASFYYPGTDNYDLADSSLEEPDILDEFFPENQDMMQTTFTEEDELQEQPIETEEWNEEHQPNNLETNNKENQEIITDEIEDLIIPEVDLSPSEMAERKINLNRPAAIYQCFPNIDEELKFLFVSSQKDNKQENVFERHQKKAEQKEIEKSFHHIKKELSQQEIAYSQAFEQEKARLEKEKQSFLERVEEEHHQQLEELQESYQTKKEKEKESIQQETSLQEEQAKDRAEKDFQQKIAEIKQNYLEKTQKQIRAAEDRLESKLQEEKNKKISHYEYEKQQKEEQEEKNIQVKLQELNQQQHTELQTKLYQLAEEENRRIQEVIDQMKPQLDEMAKLELEEKKLQIESEAAEKYAEMEREVRMKQLQQEKELEESKLRKQEKQQQEEIKYRLSNQENEQQHAVQLIEQLTKILPVPANQPIPINEPKRTNKAPLIYAITAVICAIVIGVSLFFGIKLMNDEHAPASAEAMSQEAQQKATVGNSPSSNQETPSLDALLNQKEYVKAAQSYPEARNQIEQTIFNTQDKGALQRFNDVYTSTFGSLDFAILDNNAKEQTTFYEKNKNLSYSKKQLEAIGESYLSQNQMDQAKEVQQVVKSDDLQEKINEIVQKDKK